MLQITLTPWQESQSQIHNSGSRMTRSRLFNWANFSLLVTIIRTLLGNKSWCARRTNIQGPNPFAGWVCQLSADVLVFPTFPYQAYRMLILCEQIAPFDLRLRQHTKNSILYIFLNTCPKSWGGNLHFGAASLKLGRVLPRCLTARLMQRSLKRILNCHVRCLLLTLCDEGHSRKSSQRPFQSKLLLLWTR